MRRELLPLVLVLAWGCSESGGTRLASVAGRDLEPTVRVTILHTNDVHGQVQPRLATWVDPANPPEVGGMLAIATYVREIRSEVEGSGGHLLLTDGGDIFQGTPEGTLTKGDLMVALMNHMGYLVAAVGNHEYDLGQANFERLAVASRFPWLGANVAEEGTGRVPPSLATHVLEERGGIRFAILGVTTSEMKLVTGAGLTDGLSFGREEDAVIRVAEGLDKEAVDFWILLSHSGVERDKELAAKFPRLGVVLGGHSHTGLPEGWVDPGTGVHVYQSFGKASAVTRVDLVFSRRTRKLLSISGGLVEIPVARFGRDPDLVEIAASYTGEIDRVMAQKVGELATPLPMVRGPRSSPLGNWLTDCMRRETKVAVALHNKTGIRAELPAGTILRRHLFEVSPFGNTLVTMDLTGHQLRTLLEGALEEDRKLLEVSGISIVHDARRPPGARILEARVGGAPLDPEAVYSVVTNSFLADGGDGHRIFTEGVRRVQTGIKMGTELEEKYLGLESPLGYAFENRLVGVEEAAAPEGAPPERRPPGVGIALALGEPEAASANAILVAAGESYRERTGAAFETVAPFSEEERLENLRLLVRRGTFLVVAAAGDGYAAAIREAAAETEGVKFVLLDAPSGLAPERVRAIDFAREEVGFVLGAMAAGLAGGREVVLLTGDGSAEALELENGFLSGWAHGGGGERAPPAVRVADSAAGYEDPGLAAERAAALVEGGTPVVVHSVGRGAPGLERAVTERGGIALGFADLGAETPPGVALRVRLRPDRALARAVDDVTAGRFEAGRTRFGLADGLAEFACPDPADQAKVDELARAVAALEIRVPAQEGR